VIDLIRNGGRDLMRRVRSMRRMVRVWGMGIAILVKLNIRRVGDDVVGRWGVERIGFRSLIWN